MLDESDKVYKRIIIIVYEVQVLYSVTNIKKNIFK